MAHVRSMDVKKARRQSREEEDEERYGPKKELKKKMINLRSAGCEARNWIEEKDLSVRLEDQTRHSCVLAS